MAHELMAVFWCCST